MTGPQQVLVKATDHRSEMWVGANGANITFSLEPTAAPNPRSATLSGSLSLATLPALMTSHYYVAQVTYSQSDFGDDENGLATPNNTNQCVFATRDSPCTFTVVTRTGEVALLASVLEVDTKGTPGGNDDIFTQAAWAARPAVTVAANATMTGMDLTPIVAADTADLTINLGTPPSTLTDRVAAVQIELADDAVFFLGIVPAPSSTLRAPKLSAITGATAFRLIAPATDSGPPVTESIVMRRHLAASPLAAGTWLSPPGTTDLSRTGASWAPVSGATMHSVDYTQGAESLLYVMVFDDTALFTIPDVIALAAGPLSAKFSAIGATGLDVTNFSLAADRDKLDRVSTKTIELP